MTTTTTTTLTVPDITPDDDNIKAALRYAAAGFYVGPVKHRTKDPRSTLGKDWPKLTSTDPEVIVDWFAGTNKGVFLHAGRSGAIAFDVDKPGQLHPDIRRAIDELHPPYQTTRDGESERGHYLFAVPPGRTFGNGLGKLASGWGEIRGRNGLIIVAPSTHLDDDGLYVWRRTGPVPTLPDYLAEQLPDALDSEGVATDAAVAKFLDEHTTATRPNLLDIHCQVYSNKVEAGESRHDSMTGHLAGAMKDAAAGYVDARTAADTLEALFVAAVLRPPNGRKQGAARSKAAANNEWHGLLAWAVAQAKAKDPAAHRVHVEEKVLNQFTGLLAPGHPALNGNNGNAPGDDDNDLDDLDDDEQDAPTATADKTDAKNPTQAARAFITRLALARYEPLLADTGELFAVARGGESRTPLMLGAKCSTVKSQLMAYMQRKAPSRIPSSSAWDDGLAVFAAVAAQQTERHQLWLRVAQAGESIVLDLGRPNSSACVIITRDGWTVADHAPPGVYFRRPPSLQPLPNPAPSGGNGIDVLRDLLLLDADDQRWHLIRGWLVASLRPETPRPILLSLGAAGSGKTSRALLCINVLDPRELLGSAFGKNLDDDRTAALSRYLVGWDNITSVSGSISDHIARLVTGESAEKRKHYADTDTVTIQYRRTGLMTAVNMPALAPDALDRVVALFWDDMPAGARKSEAAIWATFREAHPAILAGVLDGVVRMLANLPAVESENPATSRMKDYAFSLLAYDPACAEAFEESVRTVRLDAAEDDPFVQSVKGWLDLRPDLAGVGMTAAEAFNDWREWRKPLTFMEGDTAQKWPGSARVFSRWLTTSNGPLKAVGVTVTRSVVNGSKRITFSRGGESA